MTLCEIPGLHEQQATVAASSASNKAESKRTDRQQKNEGVISEGEDSRTAFIND